MALPGANNTISKENARQIGFSTPQVSIPSVFLHNNYSKRASGASNRSRIAWQTSFGAALDGQVGGKRRLECYPTASLQTNAVRSAIRRQGRLKKANGVSYRYPGYCLTSFFAELYYRGN